MVFPIRPIAGARVLVPPHSSTPISGSRGPICGDFSARFSAICGISNPWSPRSMATIDHPPLAIDSGAGASPQNETIPTPAHQLPTQSAGGPPITPRNMGRAFELRFFNNREQLISFAHDSNLRAGDSAAGIFLIAQTGWIQGRIKATDAAQPHLAEFVILVDHEGRMIQSSAIASMNDSTRAVLGELYHSFGAFTSTSAFAEDVAFIQLYRERLGRLGRFEGQAFPDRIPDYQGTSAHARDIDRCNAQLIREYRGAEDNFTHPLETDLHILSLFMNPTGRMTLSDQDTPMTLLVDSDNRIITYKCAEPLTQCQQATIGRTIDPSALSTATRSHMIECAWQLYRLNSSGLTIDDRIKGQFIDDIFEQCVQLNSTDHTEDKLALYSEGALPTLRPTSNDGATNSECGELRLYIKDQKVWLDCSAPAELCPGDFDAIRRFVLPKATAFLKKSGSITQPPAAVAAAAAPANTPRPPAPTVPHTAGAEIPPLWESAEAQANPVIGPLLRRIREIVDEAYFPDIFRDQTPQDHFANFLEHFGDPMCHLHLYIKDNEIIKRPLSEETPNSPYDYFVWITNKGHIIVNSSQLNGRELPAILEQWSNLSKAARQTMAANPLFDVTINGAIYLSHNLSVLMKYEINHNPDRHDITLYLGRDMSISLLNIHQGNSIASFPLTFERRDHGAFAFSFQSTDETRMFERGFNINDQTLSTQSSRYILWATARHLQIRAVEWNRRMLGIFPSLHDFLVAWHGGQLTRHDDDVDALMREMDDKLKYVAAPQDISVNIRGGRLDFFGTRRLQDGRIAFTSAVCDHDQSIADTIPLILSDYNHHVFPTDAIFLNAFRGTSLESQIAEHAPEILALTPIHNPIDVDLQVTPGSPLKIRLKHVNRRSDGTLSIERIDGIDSQGTTEEDHQLRAAQRVILDGFKRYNDSVRIPPIDPNPIDTVGTVVDDNLIASDVARRDLDQGHQPVIALSLFDYSDASIRGELTTEIHMENSEVLKRMAQEAFATHREVQSRATFGSLFIMGHVVQEIRFKTKADGHICPCDQMDSDGHRGWVIRDGILTWFDAYDFQPRTELEREAVYRQFEMGYYGRRSILRSYARFQFLSDIGQRDNRLQWEWRGFFASVSDALKEIDSSTDGPKFIDLMFGKKYQFLETNYRASPQSDEGIYDPFALLRLKAQTAADGTISIEKIYGGMKLEGPHTQAIAPVEMPPEELSAEAAKALSIWEYIKKTVQAYNEMRRAR